jgi:L-ascorbate metabolism protein UlaG (beta-lactamase superfamily)
MSIELRYMGVSFFAIKLEDGKTILIDPCITINPDCPVSIDQVRHPEAVLVTHAARDHIGDTIPIMEGGKGTLVCPRNVRTYVSKKGLTNADVKGAVAGVEREVAGIKVKAFETRHGGYIECEGQYLSDVSLAYMLYLRPDLKLLHMGDTALYSDLKMIGEIYRPDIVLVPIGMFPGGVVELNPYEAAVAISWLKPKKAIPMHYDRQTQSASPREFISQMRDLAPTIQVITLQPGDKLEL